MNAQVTEWMQCPSGYKLAEFQTKADGWSCSECDKKGGKRFAAGTTMYGCEQCNYDVCKQCSESTWKAEEAEL